MTKTQRGYGLKLFLGAAALLTLLLARGMVPELRRYARIRRM
jgi:hypothetical protein